MKPATRIYLIPNSIDNSLCKDAGIKFSYDIDEDGFTFIIYRKKIMELIKTGENVTVNVTLNKMEKLVYQLLTINPQYSRDELAEKTSKTVRTVQRTLDSLREKGYIRFQIVSGHLRKDKI